MHVQPSQLGMANDLVTGSIFRPLRQLIAGGMAYVMPRATTEADTMALNALVEPRNTQPKIMTQAVVKYRELSGRSNLG